MTGDGAVRYHQRRARPLGERRKAAFLIGLMHLAPLVGLWIGPNALDWRIVACVYPFQAIGIGVSLHRYFAHRSFKTSRPFQFFLALCSASIFGDPVGFAGKHRIHHQHVDRETDVHTPLHGWWACWMGSLLDSGYTEEEILRRVADLRRYPELMWIHRNARLPGLTLIALAALFGGVTAGLEAGLVAGITGAITAGTVGVCLPTIVGVHQTSAVNYFTHKYGTQRFETGDHSTNNLLVALVTWGEGWHNNHHRYPRSARAGFLWWEIDPFFWVIWLFERLGLVWDVRRPPLELTKSPAVRAEASTA
ncbi:MAG: acyl-CoA desaturase [bacterium]|nr:acyl-CoA desaturase [bacterium]